MSAADDPLFMARALGLAQRAWGDTHPNPMVGAVLVEDGAVASEAFHESDGGPHAERAALASLMRNPRPGATLYVTLEPCSTQGRTGACTDAIIAAGIKRVVVGAADPNPAHAGRGFEVLRRAGVDVETGVLGAECADLNLIFNHWIARGSRSWPARSRRRSIGRDSRTRTGDSRWITGETARGDVQRWRRLFPAIAVGAGTVLADNPSLTARVAGAPVHCPVRFVFDGHMRTVGAGTLPRVYSDEFAGRTVVVTTQHGGAGYVRKLRQMGVGVWVFEAAAGRVPLADFRAKCAAEGITGVLFEGGAQLLSRAATERQLDYLFAYQAPILLADERAKPVLGGMRTEGLAQALRLADVRRATLGDDCLVRGRVALLPSESRSMRLFLASANPHKAAEFQAMADALGAGSGAAGIEVAPAAQVGGMPHVAEDTGSFEGNARKKALALRERLPADGWSLADDSGLCVDALGGDPGVESAYYAGPEADSAANLAKLVGAMRGVPDGARGAEFVCVLFLAGPGGLERSFTGRCPGVLAREPRGAGGFGYDPLFIPSGHDRTLAEMPGAEKNRLSHRGRAWAECVGWLAARCQTVL